MAIDTGKRRNGAAGPASGDAGPLWRRLLWFAGIWVASLITLSIVAYGIRAMIL